MGEVIIPHLFEGECLVRRVDRDGTSWFLAVDVCRVVSPTKNVTDAVRILDASEKSTLLNSEGGPDRLLVSESGLYCLVLRSHAAITPGSHAHRFRKWVTDDLLPTIRKTGRYGYAEAGQQELSITDKRRLVDTVIRCAGPRAGLEMWLSLGLPHTPAMTAGLRQRAFEFGVDIDETLSSGPAEVN